MSTKKGIARKLIASLILTICLWPGWFLKNTGIFELMTYGPDSSVSYLLGRISLSDIIAAVVFYIICVLVIFCASRPPEIWEYFFSAAAAVVMAAAYGYDAANEFLLSRNFLYSFLLCLAFFVFCLMTIAVIRSFVRLAVRKKRKLPSWLDKHFFLYVFIIIVLLWLPYAIVRYPGGIEWDAHRQIEQALGIRKMTAKYVPASSWFMGAFVKLGYDLSGSYDTGLFVLVIAQTIICAAIFAWSINFLRRIDLPAQYLYIATGICGIVPVFPGYMTSVVKDALFSAVVVLFITVLADNLYLGKNRKKMLMLFVSGFAMCILRNNGVLVLFPILLVLLIYCIIKKGRHASFTAIIAGVLGLYALYLFVFIPAMGIKNNSMGGELMSIPFQQTARYAVTYPEEISEEEKDDINGVLEYDQLNLYDPRLSDPIKSQYHGDSEALNKYFKVWADQFSRHPGLYFSATFNTVYGFFYPESHIDLVINSCPYWGDEWGFAYTWNDKIEYNPPESLAKARENFRSYIMAIEDFPLVRYFVHVASGVWISLGIALWAAVKRRKALLFLCIPSVAAVIECIASPTWYQNGARYALAIAYAVPLLTGLVIKEYSIRMHE